MEAHDELGVGGEDPLAGVEADPSVGLPEEEGGEERLGGDGATLEDLEAQGGPPPEEVLQDPEADAPEPDDEPAGEAEPEPEEAPEETPEEPAAEPEPEPEPAPEPEPDGKSPMRHYVILQKKGKSWIEPLDKPVDGRNGDMALRTAYRKLADGEETMELAAIPTTYFNPKKIKGRKSESYAIDLNA